MKVCIVAASNIRYSPYIFFYTDILKKLGFQYELIIPDRYGIEETFENTLYTLKWDKKKSTLVNYILYTQAVKRILKTKDYDYIIVLTSIIAVFLSLWLKKKYPHGYIVDIRDYTHENIFPYFILEKIAVTNSLLNIVSSRKFLSFLPKSHYYVCHNLPDYQGKHFFQSNKGETISIGYVGGLAYVDQCKKLMYLVSQDPRFSFEFYGTSDQEKILQEAAKEYNTDRIVFHGAYKPSQKGEILQKIDILFNAYGNGNPLLDCALSNKLYDAFVYRKPILTCPQTYMTEMAGPLAFPIDLTNWNALNELLLWYQNIDGKKIDNYCTNMIEAISKENNETKKQIAENLMKKKHINAVYIERQ